MAAANYTSFEVSVFLNRGNGMFRSATFYAVGVGAGDIAAEDWNGDSWPDVVTSGSNDLVLALNSPGPSPAPEQQLWSHAIIEGSFSFASSFQQRIPKRVEPNGEPTDPHAAMKDSEMATSHDVIPRRSEHAIRRRTVRIDRALDPGDLVTARIGQPN